MLATCPAALFPCGLLPNRHPTVYLGEHGAHTIKTERCVIHESERKKKGVCSLNSRCKLASHQKKTVDNMSGNIQVQHKYIPGIRHLPLADFIYDTRPLRAKITYLGAFIK